jgi:hypothetical protein
MKKLICLVAVLLALMGLTVAELLSGGDAEAESTESNVDVETRTSRARARNRQRSAAEDVELKRIIRRAQ